MIPDLTLFYMSIYGGFGQEEPANYLGFATGIVQAGNPPYTLANFAAEYPKFLGPATSIQTFAIASPFSALFLPGPDTGIAAGQLISGPGIPTGTVVSSIASDAFIEEPGDVTAGSQGVLNIADVSGFVQGQAITGAGIPDGTTILGVGTDSLMLSQKATATAAAVVLSVSTSIALLSSVITTLGALVVSIYNAPPVPLNVIQLFINLATASLPSSRWREMWTIAMGWFVAHFLTLYAQSEGVNAPPAAAIAAGYARGILTSKSADGLSMGFQPTPGLDSWAAWTLTTYGQQLATMAKVVGAGPTYIR